MQTKTKKALDHKRHGKHHRASKQYKQIYWPYLPLVAFAIVLLVVSIFPHKSSSQTLAYATEMSRQTLLQATNIQRTNNGKENLSLNDLLSQAAQAKAEDMAKRDYWSHKTPEGQDPWIFVDQTGYKYYKAGENLAYGFGDSSTTVSGWMNSPTHRDNLLDSAFTEVGFGFSNASNYQRKGEETIVVALYGRPQTLTTLSPDSEIAETLTNGLSESPQSVTKVEALAGDKIAWAPFAIGLLSGGAVTGLILNHGLRLRRLIKKSEHYFVAHPVLDAALIIIAFACVELSRTIGYIN
jgi:uncharacterized protein YkwD